jgi:lysyl-tRNA synthetase class 2
MSSADWWHPDQHRRRRPGLILRNNIKTALRSWFVGEGFTEVDAGALQVSPGNETHLHALATFPHGRDEKLYLHTSPEFSAKKLLAAGETKIFDFAHVFRDRESGDLNVTEFTLLEWYRARETYDVLMDDTLTLLRTAAEVAGTSRMTFRGLEAMPLAEAERLPVVTAFAEFASIDLMSTLGEDGTPNRLALVDEAVGAGIRIAADDNWSDIFSRVMAERVEPRLGIGRPTLLIDYPAPEAALARRHANDPRLAERFELFICGVELANGFGELTDPEEQRVRFEAAMNEKMRVYGEQYPIDQALLAALDEMPEASGVAMGFDRLVMLCTGADRVADVMWTPPPDPASR